MADDVAAPSTSVEGSGPIVCLAAHDDPDDYFLDQEHALGAITWSSPPEADDEAWLVAAGQGVQQASGGRPVHAIAVGGMSLRALLLATRYPDLIKGLQLIDPVIDRGRRERSALLRAVRVPTLVVVSAPDHNADLTAAQAIAGGVENGVMIILDRTHAPGHQVAPKSVNEWVTTFMQIAEGLFELRTEHNERETTDA